MLSWLLNSSSSPDQNSIDGVDMSDDVDAQQELLELKANVRNIGENLRSVCDRIDRLERRKRVDFSPSIDRMEISQPETEVIVKEDPVTGAKTTTTVTTQRVVKSTSYQKALIGAYDAVARREFEPNSELVPGLSYLGENPAATYRYIGIRKPTKSPDDHLGISVREENGQLVVARVIEESPISKQGLLHPGDTILEVNGKEVKDAEQLKEAFKAASNGIIIKVIPAPIDLPPNTQAYVKAFFDYDPQEDDQIPCKEIGLPFKAGDILQIISKDDGKWWQARRVYDPSRIGLIPSQSLEENRRASAGDAKKSNFDRHELLIYEEVGRLSPYGRRVLVLLGAPGVGRRTLKSRLLRYDPLHFATIVPNTSRTKRQGEVEGREYNFVKREDMQKAIEHGDYMEWGEFNGNFYGTSVESVREIVRSGKMCVLDASPNAIKHLYNYEFMPYIVYISPPPFEELKNLYSNAHIASFKPKTEADLQRTCDESNSLEQTCRHFFDLQLVNRNAEVTFRRLLDALETLKAQPQWVPITWLYG